MILIRSLIFVIWQYGSMAAIAIGFAPFALFSERAAIAAARVWARGAVWGLAAICGVRVEFRGVENIPKGRALVASKHLSMLDTILPFAVFRDPAIVLKKELLSFPVFGWYCQRAGMIVVDRSAHAIALRGMLRDARVQSAKGRAVFIFPEGTRQQIGAPPTYKPGVAALYRDLGLPCTPVAMNTGLFWPEGIMRRPGVAVVEFLPAIPPGLSREAFMTELERVIEGASNRLLDEAR
jgi:1-acyl-sn-glycerol-3-phosphate acyltransferase